MSTTGKRLECRIVLTWWGRQFDMGMYDPISGKYEPLGRHPTDKAPKIIGDLRARIEQERHVVTFSEVTGPR